MTEQKTIGELMIELLDTNKELEDKIQQLEKENTELKEENKELKTKLDILETIYEKKIVKLDYLPENEGK